MKKNSNASRLKSVLVITGLAMAQTQAQKTKAIRFGSGVLNVDGINLWLLDNAQMVVVFNTVQLRAHNWYLPVKKKIENVEFTAELYEVHLDSIEKIDSHGILTNTAWSALNVTSEALGTGWIIGSPLKLANKNGNSTEVSSIVIDADWSALTDWTDYEVYVADGNNGDTWYTYIIPLTVQAWVLDADYTYTPNTKKTITFSDLSKLVSYYEVKFINTDENGKKFTLTIPKAYSTENLTLNFVSDDAVDETMKIPIKLKAFPDDSNVVLVIDDEQSV